MLYRQCGIRHTTYEADRALVVIPWEKLLAGLLGAAALAAPLYLPGLYLVGYLTPWLLWTAAALGLNVLMGWAGQIHLGYAAVMAVGAYTSVHLAHAGVPFLLAVPLAGAAAALVGAVFGVPALRVKGLYLAVSTLALQYLVDWVIVHVPAISGGAQSTLTAPPVRLLGLAVRSDAGLYWTALGYTLLATLFVLNLRRTAIGRALMALRERDYAAEIIGIDVHRYKAVAFGISSFLGGMTGAMLAFVYYGAVTPEQFALDVSIQAVAMVIIGGLGSVIGSYFGAGFVLLAPIFIDRGIRALAASLGLTLYAGTLSHLPLVVYGGLIVGFLLLEPLGLAKLYDNVRNYFLVWPFGYTGRSGS
ncbi:branched-chain amino acid ABC transporter permease [Limnochorda pilosa]|uniref:Branched-chain amino acid ABC transporter permease n=1 Tax=Limnochorda pilosa TaxID=1555112 RepID=A0A0K2SK59_LIMPI|nr:branched-chain amino acid ABC transporter permease [Limnochorda pilosa]BAS27214.1 branched-chain amino acid ABC transporter permease [Limnochorda pilosa]